jgi:hypothetical protein
VREFADGWAAGFPFDERKPEELDLASCREKWTGRGD